MTPLETRLRELLDRAIFIPKDQRDEILAADPLTQADILQTLEEMDAHQTKTFTKAVERKPWFFEEWFERIEANSDQDPKGGKSK